MSKPFDPMRPPSPFDPDFERYARELGPQLARIVRDLDPTALYTLLRYATTALPTGSPVRDKILGLISQEQRAMYLSVYDEMRADGTTARQHKDLLKVLAHRNLVLDEPLRGRLLGCTDEAQLERWFDRALAATTLAEVFSEP
jgi:hypothetical protein